MASLGLNELNERFDDKCHMPRQKLDKNAVIKWNMQLNANNMRLTYIATRLIWESNSTCVTMLMVENWSVQETHNGIWM